MTAEEKSQYQELMAEVRALRDIITKMETWCLVLDADLSEMQDKLRKEAYVGV